MGYADKIRLLLEWSPAINYIIAITQATTQRDRVYRSLELCDYLASRTPTPVDNELIAAFRAVLMTPQGAALIDYLAGLLKPLLEQSPPQ